MMLFFRQFMEILTSPANLKHEYSNQGILVCESTLLSYEIQVHFFFLLFLCPAGRYVTILSQVETKIDNW